MAGRMGPLRGEWGLSPPFSFFFSFSPFSLIQKNRHLFLRHLFLIPPYSHIQLFCFSCVLSHLPFPTPLICSGIWRRQPCPTQRCQKWGLNFWTNDMGHAPCASPPPAPPDGFITSYAAHLKPIESLGGRECLTQISTSEGVSATLGNC